MMALLSFGLPRPAVTQVLADGGDMAIAVPAAPEDGGPRRWQVVAPDGISLHKAATSSSAVIDTVTDGAVLSNLGCNKGPVHVWCQIRPLRGGPRGYVEAQFLEPARGPDGVVPMGVDDSARRARKRDFDAKGTIPCAQVQGQELGDCSAAVARGTGGDATVVATFSNGFARTLFFVHGAFRSANATMSGVGNDTDWRLDDGIHLIRVDDQRFELPDTLVFNGTSPKNE